MADEGIEEACTLPGAPPTRPAKVMIEQRRAVPSKHPPKIRLRFKSFASKDFLLI
jgi:hypothetical protein